LEYLPKTDSKQGVAGSSPAGRAFIIKESQPIFEVSENPL